MEDEGRKPGSMKSTKDTDKNGFSDVNGGGQLEQWLERVREGEGEEVPQGDNKLSEACGYAVRVKHHLPT